MNKEQKMTRTIELLKEIEEMENNFSDRLERRQLKSQLRGRLDALEEEETYLIQFEKDFQCITPILIDEEIEYRLAYIQEEIKLIEEKI